MWWEGLSFRKIKFKRLSYGKGFSYQQVGFRKSFFGKEGCKEIGLLKTFFVEGITFFVKAFYVMENIFRNAKLTFEKCFSKLLFTSKIYSEKDNFGIFKKMIGCRKKMRGCRKKMMGSRKQLPDQDLKNKISCNPVQVGECQELVLVVRDVSKS